MYTPGGVPTLPMVPVLGWYVGSWASGVFEASNRAVYFPVVVGSCTVRRLWWANGATVSASYNIDIGIYADAGYKPGSRLVSAGSTAQGTANQVQFVDVTDTVLAPGLYWVALTVSSASATLFRALGYGLLATDAAIRFQETAALPLPSSATPVESAVANIYLFGFSTTASP